MLKIPTQISKEKFYIWLVGVFFVLFQFSLQLSSGVVIGAIMHEINLTALTAGILSSAFYFIYTILQIPTGIFFDFKDARFILTINALICSAGCFLFAMSHSLIGLFTGRLLIGGGSAFAFVGLSHLLRQHFPIQQFAFWIGLSETLGFIATTLGLLLLGTIIATVGWRGYIAGAGVVGIIISYFCWHIIPTSHDNTLSVSEQSYIQHLMQVLKKRAAWINGLFVGLIFIVVTTFGALWAIPFLQLKLHISIQQASYVSSLFFLGTAISCPLFGWLSILFKKRRALILSSSLSTTFFLCAVLYLPTTSYWLVSFLMFLIGVCCGAYMLAYSIANELAPQGSLSTCTGFTNTLAVVVTPICQPLIGYILDVLNPSKHYTLLDYQYALFTIPFLITLASLLVFFLPEKS